MSRNTDQNHAILSPARVLANVWHNIAVIGDCDISCAGQRSSKKKSSCDLHDEVKNESAGCMVLIKD